MVTFCVLYFHKFEFSSSISVDMGIYQVKKLKTGEEPPFHLLLLADETREAIDKYIDRSDVYVVSIGASKNPIGVFVLHLPDPEVMEIKNIAVSPALQGQGVGSFMMGQIEGKANNLGCQEIIVGTPDTARAEIRFYEKNGFVKYDIRKNFFVENYPDPIIENGVVLKDMQMLRKVLFTSNREKQRQTFEGK